MMYLGSDIKRPTNTWNEADPQFYVEEKNLQYSSEKQDEIEQVKSNFSKENIYYVGSHEGCGCGFRQEWFWMQDEEDVEKTSKNQRQLFDYVSECLIDEDVIEIYACWAGSENDPAKSKSEIFVGELIKPDFFFKEDELISVIK